MKHTSTILYSVIKYIIIILIFLFLLFPVFWMLVSSLKTNMESYSYPPTILPEKPTLQPYVDLFTKNNDFFVYYKNNFIVSFAAAFIICLTAITAGYALSRLHIKLNKYIIAAFTFSQMFPVVSRLISLYDILRHINLLNTRTGLVFAVVAAQIPFSTMLMASFFDSVPKELEEAAYMDGASKWYTLVKVVVPLVVSGLLAVGIYSFLLTWDDYLHALTLIQKDVLRTLSVGIKLRYLGEFSYDWSLINCISVVGALPMVFVFFFFQRYMIKGLTAGAVKE